MRSINLIVIHCSATPNGVYVSPEQIDSWHRERGFHRDPAYAQKFRPQLAHIGYHRLILADGTIAFGRELDEVGAHVQAHNANSVGICMVGTSAFFLAQWKALRQALGAMVLGLAQRRNERVPESWLPEPGPQEAMTYFRLAGIQVCGHRDLSPDLNGDGVIEPNEWLKTCPGFDVKTWLDHGMEPEAVHVLDDHPAIAQAGGLSRAMSSMRYGV